MTTSYLGEPILRSLRLSVRAYSASPGHNPAIPKYLSLPSGNSNETYHAQKVGCNKL